MVKDVGVGWGRPALLIMAELRMTQMGHSLPECSEQLAYLTDCWMLVNSLTLFIFFVKSLELQKWIIWPCFTGQCGSPSEKSREWGTCWSWTSWYFRLLWWVFHILCPLSWSTFSVFLSHHWSLPKFHLSVPELIVICLLYPIFWSTLGWLFSHHW